jgi:hypothetical protein
MPTRKAIIAANPGETGQENYCEGVNKDMESYGKFLRSPFGGAWYETEIAILRKPSQSSLRQVVQNLSMYDYSLVVFCGHGWYSARNQSTILQLNRSESIDSKELRNGSRKHTLILDCCRKVEETILFEETRNVKTARARAFLTPSECRRYYDKRIEECSTGLIVLHACSINETAGDDSENGGYYSYSLINAIEQWVGDNEVDVSRFSSILSVPSAHDRATPKVRELSAQRQNPQIEKPRAEKYFPFAVVA